MMLDMKRTFDEVVESQATPEKARQILENPFYVALSSSFAGTQEYMAMEKLGQIHADARRDGSYDLIVVDTPPSRSALDFLDAPERLSSFLDGRFIRLLLAPARGPARLMTAGLGLITNALTKILGAQVLRDMQTFVAAFDTLFGGFRQRAQKTFELLQADGTAFLVVAAPEPDALREAAYFVERLSEDRMPLAGLVVNRASPAPHGRAVGRRGHGGRRAAARASTPDSLTAGLLRLHADRVRMVEREARLRDRFAAAHPEVPTAVVPALAGDVHDLDGPAPRRRAARRGLSPPADAGLRRRRSAPTLGAVLWRHARSRAPSATRRSAGDGAAPGARARSCRPRRPTRSGCRAPRRGTRCAPGNRRTAAWPCSAPRRARTAGPAAPDGKRPRASSLQPT